MYTEGKFQVKFKCGKCDVTLVPEYIWNISNHYSGTMLMNVILACPKCRDYAIKVYISYDKEDQELEVKWESSESEHPESQERRDNS